MLDLIADDFDSEAWGCTAFVGTFAPSGMRIQTWSNYTTLLDEALVRLYPKGQGPGIQFAMTEHNMRQKAMMAGGHISALSIDIDEGLIDLAPVNHLTQRLSDMGITHSLQWRQTPSTFKVHICLPYCEPIAIVDPDPIREVQIALTKELLPNIKTDPAVTSVNGITWLMTRRPGANDPQMHNFRGKRALDLLAMYPEWSQGMGRRRTKRVATEANEEANLLKSILPVHGWIEGKGAWDVTCPVDHEEDKDSKTLLYPSGHIVCMAGKCQGRPLAWFLDHLPAEAQMRIARASSPIKLEANTEKVSVAEAHKEMIAALTTTRPIESHATVIRVSTGAGKTRTISETLNEYSAPYDDEGANSGLTSVLAVPTNALLREVDQRITIPHRIRVGVLAVLNEDGTPACKKHDVASALQKAQGNVHKLLCGHCEYKDGCEAREGSMSGEGALTLTNHSLMSSTADELHKNGRTPLLVWDESPTWVDSAQIQVKDLTWLLREFDREAEPIRGFDGLVDAMVDLRLFSAKYRVVVRPVLEAVRWIRSVYPTGTIATRHAIDVWAMIPAHRMMIDRALAMLEVRTSGEAWEDICTVFTGAARLNTTEMGFDVMREGTKAKVLRAERLVGALGQIVGQDAVMVLSEQSIMLASITPSGQLFRQRGGVVLDATANLAQLRALRPDLRSVSLRVRDQGDTQRYLQLVAGVDRKSLAHRPERLVQCVAHAKRAAARWGRAQGLNPKIAVFTYRTHVELIQQCWPEAEIGYFGNTRGYDRFFQEGFDAFLTFGDPISNLTSLQLQWRVLTGKSPEMDDQEWRDYVGASAESELAQAHGRARNPQAKLAMGGRLHLHYGRRVPSGWDSETMKIDPLTFNEAGLLSV